MMEKKSYNKKLLAAWLRIYSKYILGPIIFPLI